MASGLLGQLELKGKVVTGDALYCQRELSLRVREQRGDYFWTLKDNQPGMREAVSLLFEEPPWGESFTYACQGGPSWRPVGKAAVVGVNSPERIPGLARTGTGLLRGADPEAQGQRDSGAGLRHYQPAAGGGRTLPGCWRYGGGTGGLRTGCHWVRGRGLW